MANGDLTVVSSDPLPLSVVSSQPIAGSGPDITNPEAMLAQSHTQAQQVIGNAADQMHGMVSFMGQPPLSIAGEKRFEDAAASPAPVPKTISEALGGTPPKVYPGQEAIAGVAEKVPQIAQAASAFPGVGDAMSLLPSTQRAGQSLQDIKTAAGSVPLDLSKVGDSALQLYEQGQRGAPLPRAVNQFLQRVTKPGSDPITYQEAKDFQSNISALSANEKMNLKPNTVRLLGQLNDDLKSSLADAADVKGKGAQFLQAMKEYHNAMSIQSMTDEGKQMLWNGALKALGVYGARKIWDAGQ